MYRLICCYFQKMIKFEHPRITRNKLSAKEIWSLTIIPEDVNLKKIAIAEFGSSEALNLLVKLFPSGSALYCNSYLNFTENLISFNLYN